MSVEGLQELWFYTGSLLQWRTGMVVGANWVLMESNLLRYLGSFGHGMKWFKYLRFFDAWLFLVYATSMCCVGVCVFGDENVGTRPKRLKDSIVCYFCFLLDFMNIFQILFSCFPVGALCTWFLAGIKIPFLFSFHFFFSGI